MSELYDLLRYAVPEDALTTIGAVLLIFGVINAFFGYKLFRLLLSLVGFLAGAAIGAILVLGSSSPSDEALIAFALLGGIIGSILAEVFHGLGVFLVVGALSMLVAYLFLENDQAALVVGVLCGLAGVFLEKYVIILSTALSGGVLAVEGFWLTTKGDGDAAWLMGVVLALGGILFQLWSNRSTSDKVVVSEVKVQAAPVQTAQGQTAKAQTAVSYCSACGAPVEPGEAFCGKCGTKI